jgi:hypothetical protein
VAHILASDCLSTFCDGKKSIFSGAPPSLLTLDSSQVSITETDASSVYGNFEEDDSPPPSDAIDSILQTITPLLRSPAALSITDKATVAKMLDWIQKVCKGGSSSATGYADVIPLPAAGRSAQHRSTPAPCDAFSDQTFQGYGNISTIAGYTPGSHLRESDRADNLWRHGGYLSCTVQGRASRCQEAQKLVRPCCKLERVFPSFHSCGSY